MQSPCYCVAVRLVDPAEDVAACRDSTAGDGVPYYEYSTGWQYAAACVPVLLAAFVNTRERDYCPISRG
eukprot:scaffold190991_cov20-Prasinocladus_malaysianus.AAC.1